jgi:hypothetical protein
MCIPRWAQNQCLAIEADSSGDVTNVLALVETGARLPDEKSRDLCLTGHRHSTSSCKEDSFIEMISLALTIEAVCEGEVQVVQ